MFGKLILVSVSSNKYRCFSHQVVTPPTYCFQLLKVGILVVNRCQHIHSNIVLQSSIFNNTVVFLECADFHFYSLLIQLYLKVTGNGLVCTARGYCIVS